jgi:Tfp pilus assembly protein PilX
MTSMTQTSHTAVARALPLLLAGSLSLLATACAAPPPPPATAPAPASASAAPAAPDAGQPLTLQGRLVLRGNAPHEQPVLQTASGETWQLKGLSAEQVTQWQRQNVEVRGQPGPRPAAGAAPSMVSPQLQVQSIRAQP